MCKKHKGKFGAKTKQLFVDFKNFISRGSVIDMAIGVVIGGAFTAIVNGFTNNILRPVINWVIAKIVGANSLDQIYTFLETAYLEDGKTIDLANSIYIDWGLFINAVINFLLIALTLFVILKIYSSLKAKRKQLMEKAKEAYLKEHPEEAPEEEVIEAPAPTEIDYLRDIANSLKGKGRTRAGRRHF